MDGCHKLCAKQATEKYSGQVAASIDLAELLGEEVCLNQKIVSTRDLTPEHYAMVDKVAEAIAAEVDKILAAHGITY